MRNLRPFLVLIWQTSAAMTLGEAGFRLIRALLPVVVLYGGKLIIDEVVALSQRLDANATVRQWFESGALDTLIALLAVELGLASMR